MAEVSQTMNEAAELTRLGADYFQLVHTADPLTATQLGVSGFDHLVPDPSRDGSARTAQQLAGLEQRLAGIEITALDAAGQVDHAVLGHLAGAARSDLEHGLWEANASAGGYNSPAAMAYLSVPTALLTDEDAVRGYLARIGQLGGYFDTITARYQQAQAEGRISTQVGLRQAIDQLAGHLAKNVGVDPLVAVAVPDGVDAAAFRARAGQVVTDMVRPAVRRLLACLESALPSARPDERVGISAVPGGRDGYLAAVRRHTTTSLTPDEIHQLGLDILAAFGAAPASLAVSEAATASPAWRSRR